jgi:hypothetical protein
LIEPTALGCEQHQFCRSRIDRSEGLDTPHDRLDANEHARSSPIGSVVDFVVFFIGRPIPEVVNSDLDEPFVDGFGQEALGQVPGEDLREQGHDIDPQGSLHRARVRVQGFGGEFGKDRKRVNFEPQTKKAAKTIVLPLACFSCLKFTVESLRLSRNFSRFATPEASECFLLGVQVGAVCSVLGDQDTDVVARLSTDAHPVIDSIPFEDRSSIGLTAHRIVVTEFFQDPTVARATLIDGAQAIERSTFAAQPLHTNTYRHREFSKHERGF